MRNTITKILATTLMLLALHPLQAQQNDDDDLKYRRSSIYSVLINHTEQNFAKEIRAAFLQMPVPDKYNDHNLSVRVLNMSDKLKNAAKKGENPAITEFLNSNEVASRLVARWFNRDKETGLCDMNLVADRGLYNATEIDKELARQSTRGMAMLSDAGEDLIGNTFVLVNDIRYVDKEQRSKKVGSFLSGLGTAVMLASGRSDDYALGQTLQIAGDLAETYKGFKVRINTFLYQLVWNDELTGEFYNTWQGDPATASPQPFDAIRGKFSLRFVGKVESKGSTTSFLGIKEDEPIKMVRKACQRALDENVVDLQREFEAFRTKSPLIDVDELRAYVGLKEGVTPDSKFEVLEVIEEEDGTHRYKRVGVIKPEKDKIWDNRFMALEEGAPNADLGYTTFRKVSGGTFYRGMLIREIR